MGRGRACAGWAQLGGGGGGWGDPMQGAAAHSHTSRQNRRACTPHPTCRTCISVLAARTPLNALNRHTTSAARSMDCSGARRVAGARCQLGCGASAGAQHGGVGEGQRPAEQCSASAAAPGAGGRSQRGGQANLSECGHGAALQAAEYLCRQACTQQRGHAPWAVGAAAGGGERVGQALMGGVQTSDGWHGMAWHDRHTRGC